MKKVIKGWIESFFEAGIIILVLYFVFFPFKISGASMESTLRDGDRVFASRIMTSLNMYSKGDLIIFNEYIDGNRVKVVKRVIALENDEVVIEGGELYINGELQSESYALGITDCSLKTVVGAGEIFVLGDNRMKSTDSRDFGAVEKENVVGRVVVKVFPLDDFCLFV